MLKDWCKESTFFNLIFVSYPALYALYSLNRNTELPQTNTDIKKAANTESK